MPKTTERVHFRLIKLPCCGGLLCNLTRLPTFCPNCGKHIYPAVRSCVLVSDDQATLKFDQGKQP